MLFRSKIYVLYKGDNMIAMGTLEEVAEKMNVKQSTILWYTTPSARRGNVVAEVVQE